MSPIEHPNSIFSLGAENAVVIGLAVLILASVLGHSETSAGTLAILALITYVAWQANCVFAKKMPPAQSAIFYHAITEVSFYEFVNRLRVPRRTLIFGFCWRYALASGFFSCLIWMMLIHPLPQ